MTVLLTSALLGCLSGIYSGGRVRNIAHLRIHRWWLLLIALVIQGTLSIVAAALRIPLLVFAAATLVVWCASNLREARVARGMVALGIGVALNTLVIALNGGMPVNHTALVDAGYSSNYNVTRGHFDKHVAPVHVHLAFLGDLIPIPVIRNILSVGDVIMLVGVFLVMRAAMLAQSATTEPNPDVAPAVQ